MGSAEVDPGHVCFLARDLLGRFVANLLLRLGAGDKSRDAELQSRETPTALGLGVESRVVGRSLSVLGLCEILSHK